MFLRLSANIFCKVLFIFLQSQIFLKRRKKVFRIEIFLGPKNKPELASLYVVKSVVLKPE